MTIVRYTGKGVEMIKVGDRVVHMGEGYGSVVAVRRGANIVLVKWDSGLCTEHYLPVLRKVEKK